MTTRGLIVGVMYLAGLAAGALMIARMSAVSGVASLVLMLSAFAIYLRGEHLNARECERRSRTGWRLQADIERLERELGIEGDA